MPQEKADCSLTLALAKDIQYWPQGLTPISSGNPSGPDRSFTLPKAITGEQLCKAVESQTFIKNGVVRCAEGIKYDFRMGNRILKAKFGKIEMDKLSEERKAEMVIEPGEVVFVLTEETLELPENIMVQLMPKRKLSHDGILVLGGFCVDPLYTGKLLVGLYNFSSSPYPLDPGRKLIAAVFYELQEEEKGAFKKPESAVMDFDQDLVRLISLYQPIDTKTLHDEIVSLEGQISNLRTEITSDKEWKKDFQTKLQQQTENVDKLLKGLEDEKDNRLLADRAIGDQLNEIKVKQAANDTQGATSHTLLIALISIAVTFILTAAITVLGYWLATRSP
jgi:deoxycytidine triphosphate deaminase